MNQDQVKALLLQVEDTELEFSVTFTGKESKKVNGLYKPDTHEILLHNKNFSVDNELLYTAIHEYTHHRLFELDGIRAGRVHTQRFWSYFHRLLQKAEEKGIYKITLEESPELLELTETIRTTIMTEDGKLMKELGRLLGKARPLCKQAGVRYEDYIDRVLCLPRTSAATVEKMHAFDIKPELGYEAMKVVANIADPDKRVAAEELFLHKNSPASVRDTLKTKPQEEDPRRKLENEKRRIERTIASLQSRLSELEDTLAHLPVTPFILCVALLLRLLPPLAADTGSESGGRVQVPAIPAIPEITINGNGFQRPVPPVITPPVFQKSAAAPAASTGGARADGAAAVQQAAGVQQYGSAGDAAGNTGSAGSAAGQSGKKSARPLTGLNAKTLAALAQNSGNLTLLNGLLGGDTGMFGGGETGTGTAGVQTVSDNALLTRILAELEKLQAQTAKSGSTATGSAAVGTASTGNAADSASGGGTGGSTAAGKTASGTASAQASIASGAAAELIRLRINGREIKNDLVYTFCSRPAANGTFLYGADRRFTVNGAEYNETAYFLCKETEPHRYEISMDMRQAPLNPNSFLYKLYELSPVSVTQTSDILFWHYKAADFEAELVFRLAETEHSGTDTADTAAVKSDN